MSQPHTTVNHTRDVILLDDPAIGKVKGYQKYHKSGDESLLELKGEPTRYVMRPIAGIVEQSYVDGVEMSTQNQGLQRLAVIRLCLVRVKRPDGSTVEFKATDRMDIGGALVLRPDIVEAVLPTVTAHLQRAMLVLSDVVYRMSMVTDPLPSDSG